MGILGPLPSQTVCPACSTVKNSSIAVGKQIAQTAESLLVKNTELVTVDITSQQIKYMLDNLGSDCLLG